MLPSILVDNAEVPLFVIQEDIAMAIGSYLSNEDGDQRIELAEHRSWTIGRVDHCEITIRDPRVSREHATLYIRNDGSVQIVDQGSQNGTVVNGRRIKTPQRLWDGYEVRIGQQTFIFHDPNQETFGLPEDDDFPPTVCDAEVTQSSVQHRLVSVLVVDIRDYTVLARELGERGTAEVMQQWYGEAGQIIRDFESVVDQFTGDGLMATWLHPDQTARVDVIVNLLGALRSLYFVTQAVNSSNSAKLPFPLRLGAGITTGFAMVGKRGMGEKSDFGVMGETVNHAFRLESATKTTMADLVMGDETYATLSDRIPVCPLVAKEVELKGYDKPTKAFVGSVSDLDSILRALDRAAA